MTLPRIFHVEDTLEWRELVSKWLLNTAEVTTFTAIFELEKRVRQFNPDLVICDGWVESPDDGVTLAVKLAREGHKVILLTSNGLLKEELESLEHEFKFKVVVKGAVKQSKGTVLQTAVMELLSI